MCLFCLGKKGKCAYRGKSCWLMTGSVLAVILAAFGAWGSDFYLASTQWLLVSLVLAVWAVFLKE